jgi:uncharacterized protein YndB with AHSA1/START domain
VDGDPEPRHGKELSLGSVVADTSLGAPPEVVWAYVTEPDNFPAFVDGYAGGQVATTARTGVGARYEWVGRVGPLRIATTEEVVEWHEGHRVAYRGETAGASFDSAVEVAPDGRGESLLQVEIAYRLPARLGGRVLDALVVRRLVRSHVDRSLRTLAKTFG